MSGETTAALPTKIGSYEITRLNALRHGVLSKHTACCPGRTHANTTRWSTRSPKSTRREVPTEEHLVEELAAEFTGEKTAASHGRGFRFPSRSWRSTLTPYGGTVKAALSTWNDPEESENVVEERSGRRKTDRSRSRPTCRRTTQ